MKITFRTSIYWGLVLLAVSMSPAGVYAQAGVSSASASRSRAESESQPRSSSGRPSYSSPSVLAVPDPIAVEEIVNYHRHRLPLPKSGQGVALDVRWGNQSTSSGQPAVLQIGLATTEFNDTSDLGPLNLALVIDRSGSMAASDKMTQVKDALHTLTPQALTNAGLTFRLSASAGIWTTICCAP